MHSRVAAALMLIVVTATLADMPAKAQSRVPDNHVDLHVALSSKAAATLITRGEKIVVYASYYGAPKPDAHRYVDEVGQIDLGHREVTIAGKSGPARVEVPAFDAAHLAELDGPVMINVNVYTARLSDNDNLLACDFIDGKLADVRKTPVVLHCGLIDEHPETRLKP